MIIRMLFCAVISALPISAFGVEVTKADWMSAMETAVPTAFCNSNQFFRQCFNVTAQECEETAASATRVCLNKNQRNIPSILVQPADGTHWGTVVGSCAGTTYATTLSTKLVKNEKCNNPKNWQ